MIFCVIKVSYLLDNSDLANGISLTVTIISLFWRHSQDKLPECSRRSARGRVDHTEQTHAESSHLYALVIATFHISTYWAAWNSYLHGFPTHTCLRK